MINSTTSADRAASASAVPLTGQPGPRPTSQISDRLSTESATYLSEALTRQPEIRPEVVERAKALAADPNYPSLDTLRSVGKLILSSPDLSEDQS